MKILKVIWNWISTILGFTKSVKDFSDTMKKLQEQATKERQIHLDKMVAARGGKKKKLEGKMFHNPKFEGTYVRDFPKIGRNALCPCGSKLKSKRCCLA